MRINTLNKILLFFSGFLFLNVWMNNFSFAANGTLILFYFLIPYLLFNKFEYAVYVLAFCLPYESILFAWGAGRYNSVSYLAILVMIFGILKNKISRKSLNSFEMIFLIFILLNLLSLLWTPEIKKSLQAIFVWFGLFSITYTFHRSTRDEKFLVNCLSYFCWGVGILSLSLFTQYSMEAFIYGASKQYYSTLSGDNVSPYDIAHYNSAAFICCLFLFDLLRKKSQIRFNIIGIIFFSVSIILSVSRSFVIAYLLSVFSWLIFSKGITVKIKRIFFGAACGLAILFFALKINSDVLEERWVGETLAQINELNTRALTAGREYIWEVGYELFLQKPILGHGANQFSSQFLELEGIPKGAHNQFMKYVVEFGLLGLIIFILMLLALFVILLFNKNYKGVAMATFTSLLCACFFHGFYREKGYWFIIGLMFSTNMMNNIYQNFFMSGTKRIK